MPSTFGTTRQSKDWSSLALAEGIASLPTTEKPTDDLPTATKTNPQQPPSPRSSLSSLFVSQDTTALDQAFAQLPLQPFSPLSKPPAPTPTPPANSGGGGGGGASTPNAGGGGGGPTGGGGGPGLINSSQFMHDNLGGGNANVTAKTPPTINIPTAPPAMHGNTPANGSNAPTPLTAFQTTYATTAPTHHTAPHHVPPPPNHGLGKSPGGDPLYVLDTNTGETIPVITAA